MNWNRFWTVDGKSLIVGAVFALAFIALLGADKSDSSKVTALPQRFLVLESKPVREAASGYSSHLLKVCPFYGKIDRESLTFRLAVETQEIEMIVAIAPGQEIDRGDIIVFGSFQQMRLTPGSRVVRHLPDGGQELVP